MPGNYSLHTVEVPLPPLERFKQFLQANGKRITRQRQHILETIYSHHDHFDADELMNHLRDLIDSRQVSRPTVYRTLSELVAAGMLRKMSFAGRSVYEHDYGYPTHDHLHCEICNQLIEFHSAELEQLRDAVAQEHDFQVVGHRMFINGICRKCQQMRQANEASSK